MYTWHLVRRLRGDGTESTPSAPRSSPGGGLEDVLWMGLRQPVEEVARALCALVTLPIRRVEVAITPHQLSTRRWLYRSAITCEPTTALKAKTSERLRAAVDAVGAQMEKHGGPVAARVIAHVGDAGLDRAEIRYD